MKSNNFINQGTVAVALAMILGSAAANAKDVYLQAGEFEKTVATNTQDVAIANPDFEAPNISDCTGIPNCNTDATGGNWVMGSFSGWTVTGTGGLFRPDPVVAIAPSVAGSAQVGWSAGATLSQQVTGLTAGTTYTLSVDVGDRNDSGFGSYTIGLYEVGTGTALATASAPVPSDGWVTATVDYIAAATDVEIRLTGAGSQEEFDNVRLYTQTPVTTTMWGYSECTGTPAAAGDFTGLTCGAASSPGPQIDVPDSEGLTVYLSNTLPEATSLMIAGQKNIPLTVAEADSQKAANNGRVRSFVPEVNAGSVGTYSFADLAPGAFLYQSGSFVAKQVQMGLNGAVVKDAVCDAGLTAPCAYPDVSYDAQQVLVFSEIDPALHNPPTAANASKGGYAPRYFLINGESFAGATPAPVAGSVVYDGAPVTTDVTVVNASFEIPDCTTGCINDATRGNYAVGSFEGWTVTGTGGVFQALSYAITVTDGAQVAWATNGSSLSQVLAEQVSADTTYTLDVQVGQRNDTTRGDATISLLAGGVEIGSAVVPAPLAAGEDWTPGHLVVDTTGMTVSGSLEIRLNGTGGQTEFDSVTLSRTGPSARSSRILLRMINAGLENHAPQMIGGYLDVIAEDGHRSPVHKSQTTVFLPSAKSMDVLFMPATDGVYPLFDRRLRLVNDTAFGGGMFHQIVVGGTP
jgi:hypothetical protein